MVEAVIFDMDGVMLNSEREHYMVEQQFFKELGVRTDLLDYNKFVGLSGRLMWTEIKQVSGLKQSVEELMQEAARRLTDHFKTLTLVPMPGLIDLLDYINERSMLMAVASSSPKSLIDIVVNKLEVREYFDLLISGDEVKKGKPFPDIYQHTAALLQASPEHCVVIEDSQNGSRAAKAAQMTCFGYKNPDSGDQDLSMCDLIVSSFLGEDLEKITANLW